MTNASITANIVPITDNVPALRDESLNQPPTGARRRTSSFTAIAAVTITTRMSGAIQVSTATYFRGAPGFAGSLNVNPAAIAVFGGEDAAGTGAGEMGAGRRVAPSR